MNETHKRILRHIVRLFVAAVAWFLCSGAAPTAAGPAASKYEADMAAFVAERLARVGLGIDTEARMPRLHALARRLAGEPAFRSTEP